VNTAAPDWIELVAPASWQWFIWNRKHDLTARDSPSTAINQAASAAALAW